MFKRMMFICAALIVAAVAVPAAKAVDLPVRETVGITNTSPATLTMPAFGGNGQLQRVQIVDDHLTNNTCVVKHLLPVPGGVRVITNAVVTVAYTTTPGVSVTITNGPYLVAGDSLTYTFGTSSTGLVSNVRTLAK